MAWFAVHARFKRKLCSVNRAVQTESSTIPADFHYGFLVFECWPWKCNLRPLSICPDILYWIGFWLMRRIQRQRLPPASEISLSHAVNHGDRIENACPPLLQWWRRRLSYTHRRSMRSIMYISPILNKSYNVNANLHRHWKYE